MTMSIESQQLRLGKSQRLFLSVIDWFEQGNFPGNMKSILSSACHDGGSRRLRGEVKLVNLVCCGLDQLLSWRVYRSYSNSNYDVKSI